MKYCLNDFEKYINDKEEFSTLIKAALCHYQFETIHPFLDGNGRLGRLLIPLYLISTETIKYPVLYLSLYLKLNKQEYYDRLTDVRISGKYEEYIKFFLRGIIYTAKNAKESILKLIDLKEEMSIRLDESEYNNKKYLESFLEYLYINPYIKTSDIMERLQVSKPTAILLIKEFVKLEIISPTSNKQRYVIYRFDKYLDILEEATDI